MRPVARQLPILRPMWSISTDSLAAHFTETDLRRGLAYVRERRVLWLEWSEGQDERAVLGEVRGGRRHPYRVHVRARLRNGRWRIESHCSCPVQVACKHAAALLQSAHVEIAAEPQTARAIIAPVAGRYGFLGTALGPPQALAVRPGRWTAHGSSWRFEEVPLSILRDLPESLAMPAARQLAVRLAPIRGSHLESQVWWILPEDARAVLQTIAGQGAFAWREPALLVVPGPGRNPEWTWEIDSRGAQRLHPRTGLATDLVRIGTVWHYVDRLARQIGALDWPLTPRLASELLALPPLLPAAAAVWPPQFSDALPANFPAPPVLPTLASEPRTPLPILSLHQSAGTIEQRGRRSAQLIAFARLSFAYGAQRVGETDPAPAMTSYDGERVSVEPRDRTQERGFALRLKQLGLTSNRHALIDHPGLTGADWIINPDGDPQSLNEFCYVMLPRLRSEGWRIEYGPRFPLKLIDTDYRFVADVEELPGQLRLSLGIEVDGERIELLPSLRAGLREGRFADLPTADTVIALSLPGEKRLPVASGKLRAILRTLEELGDAGSSDQRTVVLPRARAAALIELETELADGERLFSSAPAVRLLAERLARYSGLPATPVPKELRATLRSYQVEGLAWMRFLGQGGLSGILADDMGLGKTVQVLAHLLGEQEEGRLDRPALVVCPKSVLPNWSAEVARFAPSLSVVVYAGAERGKRLKSIAGADIVLTTYPVLSRDGAAFASQPWHIVVLDESQMVKNPATLAARAARKLDARQRLCLTGTPLENHLGELWAQFDFLLPGLLGNKTDFTRLYRKPIEKLRDVDARERLRRRIRPFLLRRTKDQVIADLPPKTEIVRSLTLEGRQRELYDSLRAVYLAELKDLIAKGLWERSRIRVLEGLTRLRQVCCDPRLLDHEVRAPSAKLEVLVDMLSELTQAGRRILVFSQFTSMLSLIEAELVAHRIRYTKLTGQTDDRATPVQRFQRGEVAVFLISLKAGGFGLNLTAADTVIHYDPWWNPAAEAQATDRAHRIGQDKPVFVYRLIASDTVEQHIQELQARKREWSAAIFDDAGQSLAAGLTADDWLDLVG